MQTPSILSVGEVSSAFQPPNSASHLCCKIKEIEKSICRVFRQESVSYLLLNFSWWLLSEWRRLPVHLRLLMGVSWPLFEIVWKFSGSNPCLALMKVFLEGALPIKCSARLLLMMTHQWGQYEKSVCCGTIDSLNQDLYRCATQHVAAWWHGEGSPWVSALKRWKHFCHELMSWADYVIWIKLSSLFREGAWRQW